MPQLDFHNVLLTSQVVWMALIFAGLYFLVSGWALPQVASVLDDRAARIGGDLDSARIAKLEADQATHEVQESTRRATTEAQTAVTEAMARAKADAARQAEDANAKLDQQLDEAERRIGDARTAAMGALRDVAADAATAVLTRLTGDQPDRAVVDQAVGDTIAAKA